MLSFDKKIFLADIPEQPGVYQMYSAASVVIYVGKAKNLKKRLSQYFSLDLDKKNLYMTERVAHVKYTLTGSEMDALLLEDVLIKKHQPEYNILLKDGKSYPYIYLSTDKDYPRMSYYRGAQKLPGRYFGPYPNHRALRDAITLVQKIFKIRPCEDSYFANRLRPCLQYQIKRCSGPCVQNIAKDAYRLQVNNAVLFLEGKQDQVLQMIEEKMNAASQVLQFEAAAVFRDQISQLRALQAKQVVIAKSGEIDVVAIESGYGAFSVAILQIRSGRVIGSEVLDPKVPSGYQNDQALTAFISQYYLSAARGGNLPQRIVVSERLTQRTLLEDALSHHYQQGMKVLDGGSSHYRQWTKMAALNARHHLNRRVSKERMTQVALAYLKDILSLAHPISRLECYDISHTQGEATVASCIVWGPEGPLRSLYRRMNVQQAAAGDDYGAMREVITRRCKRLQKNGTPQPDLLIVDGGAGQMRQAKACLAQQGIVGPVILGVVKGDGRRAQNDRLLYEKNNSVMTLHVPNEVMGLVQQMRDEAHRVAITGHRAKRSKSRNQSTLEALPGIGAKRRQALLLYFGGWQGLKQATVDQIGLVPGIGPQMAQRIYNFMQQSC